MARKRERWKRYQRRVDPSRLVFIDETWAKTNMTRTHGRALCGRRLVAAVPHARWTTMTFLAALRADGITAPGVFDGAINGCLFLAWVEQCLVPTLRPGDIVVLDNLGSHKGLAVRRAIRAAGAHLLFRRPTALTSIRSRWSSPSSKLCSAKPTSDRSPRSGNASAHCWTSSAQPNAQTTSGTQAMTKTDPVML